MFHFTLYPSILKIFHFFHFSFLYTSLESPSLEYHNPASLLVLSSLLINLFLGPSYHYFLISINFPSLFSFDFTLSPYSVHRFFIFSLFLHSHTIRISISSISHPFFPFSFIFTTHHPCISNISQSFITLSITLHFFNIISLS